MYDMVLRQYLYYYQNYDVTLDHFLTGLDALGTGRLTFQVLDPNELDRFLSAIRRQLQEERSPFELAFNHTYQFYAEPMLMFTNTHDQLLVNVDSYKCLWAFIGCYTRFSGLQSSLGIINGNRSHNKPLELI